jgi:hypothetical protein
VEQIAMAVKKGNTELLNLLKREYRCAQADGTVPS